MKHLLIILIFLNFLFSCQNKYHKKLVSIDEYKDNSIETKFCKINYRYPILKLNNKKLTKLNDSISNYINKQINNFIKNSKNDSNLLKSQKRKYKMIINTQEYVTNYGTASILITTYKYNFGAHGNYTYKTFNYDLAFRKFMNLNDIIKTTTKDLNDLNLLLKQNFNNKNCFTKKPTIDKNFKLFIIKQDSLTFLFPPYKLGPYACGLASVSVAIDELP
jgi:hypothetical protein